MQSKGFIIVLFFIGAIYVMLSVLLDMGNAIGALAQFLCIGSFIIGVFQPRATLYLMVIYAAYSDLLKRLMILDGHVTMNDVIWARGLAPLTLAGICIGAIAKSISGGSILESRKMKTLLLCILGFGVAAVSSMRSGGLNTAANQLADGAAYMFLLFVVPCVLPKPEEINRFIKYTLIVFVPVALYGLKQQIFGLSDFEIDYLRSGLTILSKHLEDVRPRPFSTLVDSSPFGTACAICACLAMVVRRYHRDHGGRQWDWLSFAIALIFIAGCLASMARIANINWLLPVLLLPVLRSGKGTATLYGGLFSLFALACIFAQEISQWVTKLTLAALETFGGTALGEQFSRFWTICDRLDGMHDIAHNPLMWTTFGHGSQAATDMNQAGVVSSHDLISNALLENGWLPTLLIGIIIAVALRSFHSSLLRLKGTPNFAIAIWMVAIEFGLLVHNVFAGTVTSTFPVNFFFWFIAGALNACIADHERLLGRQAAAAPTPQPTPQAAPLMPVFPFRKTGSMHPAYFTPNHDR
jgi:hypothetical protein